VQIGTTIGEQGQDVAGAALLSANEREVYLTDGL